MTMATLPGPEEMKEVKAEILKDYYQKNADLSRRNNRIMTLLNLPKDASLKTIAERINILKYMAKEAIERDVVDGSPLWLVLHEHKHGEEIRAVRQNEPPTQEEMKTLFPEYKEGVEWEYLRLHGPITI